MTDSQETFWIVYVIIAFAISAYIGNRWVLPWFVPFAWFAVIAFLWQVVESAINRPYRAVDLADLLMLLISVVVAVVATMKRKSF